MKVSKEFRKLSSLAATIGRVKAEARTLVKRVAKERDSLDLVESQAKGILKL